jgi:hypothetical protein
MALTKILAQVSREALQGKGLDTVLHSGVEKVLSGRRASKCVAWRRLFYL